MNPHATRLAVTCSVLSIVALCGGRLPAAGPASKPAEPSDRRATVNPLVAVLQTPADVRLDSFGDPMPAGMIQRFGSTRFKSTGWWRRMAFAGNDEWLWIKSENRVDVMHRESGRVVPFEKLRLGEANVRCIAASADGSRVAIGMCRFPRDGSRESVCRVVILSGRTTAHLRELSWETRVSDFTCLAFSSDGKKLLSGTEQGHFCLFDLDTGDRLAEQHVEGTTFRDAALSPDGKLAVLTGWNNSTRLWKFDEDIVLTPKGDRDGSNTGFAPNGKLFVTINHQGINLWDPESTTVVAHLKEASSYGAADFGIGLTPDSRFLVVPAQSEHRIELWDVERRELVATMPVDSARGVVVSSDGRWLAASGDTSAISIFDLQARRLVSKAPGHSSPPGAIRFTGDGAMVTAGTGEALVWDVASGRPDLRLEHDKPAWVRGIAISPKDGSVVTSAFDDTIGVWERSTGKRRLTLKGNSRTGSLRSVEFDADNGELVSWGDDGVLRRWNPDDGTLLSEPVIQFVGAPDPNDIRESGFVRQGVLAPRATALFFRFQNELVEVDPLSGKPRRIAPMPIIPQCVAFSADGRWIAGGQVVRQRNAYVGSNTLLVDRATLKAVRRWLPGALDAPLDGAIPEIDPEDAGAHQSPIRAVAFSPDSRRVGWSRSGRFPLVEIAEVDTGRVIARLSLQSACGCIEFSPDGRQLATGHDDTTVSLWQLDHPDFVPPQTENRAE